MAGLKFYPEEYTVDFLVPFVDLNNAAITPISVTATLYNGDDELMETFNPVTFTEGASSTTITILPGYNVMAEGATREARILRVSLSTAAGIIKKSLSYILEAEQRLVIMDNTFQSYEAAEIVTMDITHADGWRVADEGLRKTALTEAFRHLTNTPMHYAHKDSDDRVISEGTISRDEWLGLSQETFQSLPSRFKRALKLAQVLEADHILKGDEVGDKRRAGIIKETIGESSVTLNNGNLNYGLCEHARAALVGYLNFDMRIKRA
jgi:hypothetical protein